MEYELKVYGKRVNPDTSLLEEGYIPGIISDEHLDKIIDFITFEQGIRSSVSTSFNLEHKLDFPILVTMEELTILNISEIFKKFNSIIPELKDKNYILELSVLE